MMLKKSMKIGLNEDESFIHNSDKKYRVLRNNENIMGMKLMRGVPLYMQRGQQRLLIV